MRHRHPQQELEQTGPSLQHLSAACAVPRSRRAHPHFEESLIHQTQVLLFVLLAENMGSVGE